LRSGAAQWIMTLPRMSRKNNRKPLGRVPAARPAGQVPRPRSASAIPGGDPRRSPPPQHVTHPPVERPAAKPPNPRKPKLVRDVHGGELKDLMLIFPDLPRPPRRPANVPAKRIVRRRR
jgi:hypothetical protein